MSPWTKPHFVSHVVRDHTAILKFIETRFSLPPLTSRDDASDDMTEFFNFSAPSYLTPPKMPLQPFTNYVTVKSIDAQNRVVQANGGIVVLPKQEIGKGMGWISVFKDTENNVIGLHEMPAMPAQKASPKKSAKSAKKTAKKKRR